MSGEAEKIAVTFYTTPEAHRLAKVAAAQLAVSLSHFIEHAIGLHLAQLENYPRPPSAPAKRGNNKARKGSR